MDELAQFNQERWEDLVAHGIEFSRPWLDLDEATARKKIDPEGIIGDVDGKDALLLAGSGGQQSAAFSLLGARVTVFDLCEGQLRTDRETAERYGSDIKTVQGDMRDLSELAARSFDIVWHAHSLTFVPSAVEVFAQVARVIRPRGLYRIHCTNPFMHGLDEAWDGKGYSISLPYVDGEVVLDPYWDVDGTDGQTHRVLGPREFRHTYSSMINGLVSKGFVILGFSEEVGDDPEAKGGSWRHFTRIVPPWITFVTRYDPEALKA